MPKVTTSLLVLASGLVGEAVACLKDGSLGADDAQMLGRRATALNRVADLALRHGLGDVLGCANFDELARLRDKYRGRFPDLAQAIDRGLGIPERTSQ